MDDIIDFVEGLGDVLTLRPAPGDGSPEISWGDTFFYYSPDRIVPDRTQPFATIVTKNYPGDESLGSGPRGRVPGEHPRREGGVHRGNRPRAARTGRRRRRPGAPDTVIAHPVYGPLGWLAVIDPARAPAESLESCCARAHTLARSRYERRAESTPR